MILGRNLQRVWPLLKVNQ